MVKNMRENTLMIKSMGMGCSLGKMENSMRVNGSMENNMVKGSSLCKAVKNGKVNGRMEKEFVGSLNDFSLLSIICDD